MSKKSTVSLFSRNSFEEKDVLANLNLIFKKQRGYEFRMPPPGESVLLIVSGGLDSTMLWFHLLHTYKLRVFPIYLTSPFMNKNHIPGEYSSVSFFHSYFKDKYPHQVEPIHYIPVDLSFSLTSNTNINILKNNWRVLVENTQYDVKTKTGNIYLLDYPTRYARFLLSAYEYGLSLQAQKIDVSTVFFGVVPNDAFIGRESTLTTLRSLNLFFCLLLGDWKWQVTGPVEKKNQFYFSKEKSIQIAHKHDIPIYKTWSCARRFPIHCGVCNACRYRQASFRSAHVPDKTHYLISPDMKKGFKDIMTHLRVLLRGGKVANNPKHQMNQRHPIMSYEGGNISLHPQTESIQMGNKLFIHHSSTEETIRLNDIGELVYGYINKRKRVSFASLTHLIMRHYPTAPPPLIRKDLHHFIEKLKTKKVVIEKGDGEIISCTP